MSGRAAGHTTRAHISELARRLNILDVIMNAQGGAAVRQLGSQVGLGEAGTASALSGPVPALAAGFQRNLQTPEGLSGLVTALSAGTHQRYIDDPAALADPAAVAEGDGILGHVLGSKDVSREVASRAAAQTGLGPEVMKRMLPLAASLMMGRSRGRSRQAGCHHSRVSPARGDSWIC